MNELSRVRKEVSAEYKWLSHSEGDAEVDEKAQATLQIMKRRRLLYLLMKDLSSGVSGDVISNKVERDSVSMALKINRVPASWKLFGWLAVAFLNLGMLFYVYLFAMSQTRSRQAAWLQSFLMWGVFEIFISSTGLVVFVHLLIPLYVLSDVCRLKEKVLASVLSFRERFSSSQPSLFHPPPNTEFNSAKYLFTSWRVASLFCERDADEDSGLPETALILHFRTQWPSKRLGGQEGEVAAEYQEDIVLAAVSRVVTYFLGSLLSFHVLVQEMFVQMLWTSGMGYLIVWFVQLARVHPLLPLVPVLLTLLAIYGFLRLLWQRDERVRRLGLIHPLPKETPPPAPAAHADPEDPISEESPGPSEPPAVDDPSSSAGDESEGSQSESFSEDEADEEKGSSDASSSGAEVVIRVIPL